VPVSQFDLTGRVAIVTGGTGALGSAFGHALAAAGAAVGVLARNADRVADTVSAVGPNAFALSADVLDRPQLERARDEALDRHGRIDVLVNAAGGNVPEATLDDGRTFFDLPADALRKVLMEDISPNVQSEAALSLAKVGQPGVLQDLVRAMEIPSPSSVLTEACLEAAGKASDVEAREVLDRHLPYGNPLRARIGALKGLEARGYLDEGEVAVVRGIITTDREFAVRLQAVTLVSRLGDGRFLEALRKAAETDSDKRVRRRALEVLHEVTGTAGVMKTMAQLKTELQELAMENERLRAQVAGRDGEG